MENTQPITPQPPVQAAPAVPAPAGTQDYATWGSRVAASLLDGLALGIPVVIVTKIIDSILFVPISAITTDKALITFVFNLLDCVIMGLVIAHFVSKTGQTPGKKWMHIKIVDNTTKLPPVYKRAFLRATVGVLLDVFVFGVLWPLFDGQKQTPHDKFANTVVIKA